MGYKSRAIYKSACIKNCKNRGKKCKECVRYSDFEESNQ